MHGFRLGSVFGVEIRIDYSWFIIFFLILWTLIRGVFPAALPGQPPLVYVGMGLAGTLLFFASLLGHELSHSLVARSRGMPVQGITLFIFGGMARASGDFRSAEDEFVIAGVGPLSSMVIAAAFWLLAWASVQLGLPAAIAAVASYLALINLILAVFNLFPGFPLDGGRILRSIVWKRTGDPRRATKIATTGGKIFGYLLILIGVLNLFGGNPVGGLWLLFIGWFIRFAADASYTQFVMRQSFEGVHAEDAMTPHPLTVPPDLTLQRFVDEHVLDGAHQSYPVLDDGSAVGLITLPLVRAVPKAEWSARTVADAMIPLGPELTVAPEDAMVDALDKLSGASAGRILVTRGDRLVGIISHTDVARWLDRQRLREELST
jgi:Zn-dependent protease/predicted transcriptional regulator